MDIFFNIFLNIFAFAFVFILFFRWLKKCKLSSLKLIPINTDEPNKEIYTPSKNSLLKVFLFALSLRVVIYIVGYIFFCLNIDETGNNFIALVQKWDSVNYMTLAEKGYANFTENGQHLFLVFFPLYVWVIRFLNIFTANSLVSGLLSSNLLFALACCQLYRLAGFVYNKSVAKYSVLFLSLFPFSFFFGTVLTESLFLLTTVSATYYALKHKWFAFAFWGILAALSRMMGILVIVPALIELTESVIPHFRNKVSLSPESENIKTEKPKVIIIIRNFLLAIAPFLGTGAYLLLNYVVDGNPFAFSIHEKHWHQGFMWFSKVINYIFENAISFSRVSFAIWLPTIILFFLFALILSFALIRKKDSNPNSLIAFGFAYLIGNYSLSWLLSAGRYMSCGFVFFIFAAVLFDKHRYAKQIILVLEAMLLVVYFSSYLNNGQIM